MTRVSCRALGPIACVALCRVDCLESAFWHFDPFNVPAQKTDRQARPPVEIFSIARIIENLRSGILPSIVLIITKKCHESLSIRKHISIVSILFALRSQSFPRVRQSIVPRLIRNFCRHTRNNT